MRFVWAILISGFLFTSAVAEQASDAPTEEKARKSYEKALQELKDRKLQFALDDFKKSRQTVWRPLPRLRKANDQIWSPV